MSWNIKMTSANRDALCEQIQKEQHCPPQLRDMLCEQVQSLNLDAVVPEGQQLAIHVSSEGHHDQHYCYGNFKVEKTRMV